MGTQGWGQDTTITGIGPCTSCQCSEPTMRATSLRQSMPVGENFPKQRSGSWALIPQSRCKQLDSWLQNDEKLSYTSRACSIRSQVGGVLFALAVVAVLAAVHIACFLSLNQRQKWNFLLLEFQEATSRHKK